MNTARQEKRRCFLDGYGACRGKLSREHYISRSVLNQLNAEKQNRIGGLSWQPAMTLQLVSPTALQARILCQQHNTLLSPLDAVAGQLFRTLDAIDQRPDDVPPLVQFAGAHIERWFLKVLCGLVAAGQIRGIPTREVPDAWKALLVGGHWPDGWGLCIDNSPGPHLMAKEIYFETRVYPGHDSIVAVRFRLVGMVFHLVLSGTRENTGFGIHRARGMIFRFDGAERRVEFLWSTPTNDCVVYTRLGTRADSQPPWSDWTMERAE